MFGVKALGIATLTSNIPFSGLYYFSALEDTPGWGAGCGDIDSFLTAR